MAGRDVSFDWMLPDHLLEGFLPEKGNPAVKTMWLKETVRPGCLVPCIVKEEAHGLVASSAKLEFWSTRGQVGLEAKGAFLDYRALLKGMMGLACAFLVSIHAQMPNLQQEDILGPPIGQWTFKAHAPNGGGEVWSWGAPGWTDYERPLAEIPVLPVNRQGWRFMLYDNALRAEVQQFLDLPLERHEYLFTFGEPKGGGAGKRRA